MIEEGKTNSLESVRITRRVRQVIELIAAGLNNKVGIYAMPARIEKGLMMRMLHDQYKRTKFVDKRVGSMLRIDRGG